MDARTPASISANPGRSESRRASSASASPTRAPPDGDARRTEAAPRGSGGPPRSRRRRAATGASSCAPDSGGDAPRSSAVSSARAACAPSAPASRFRCLERSGEAKRGSRRGARRRSVPKLARLARFRDVGNQSSRDDRSSRPTETARGSSKKPPRVCRALSGTSRRNPRARRETPNSAASRTNSRRRSLSVSQSTAESGRRPGVAPPRGSSPNSSNAYGGVYGGAYGRDSTPLAKTRKTPSDEWRARRRRARRNPAPDGDEKAPRWSEKKSVGAERRDAEPRGADRISPRSSPGLALSARARRETRLRSRATSVVRASAGRENEGGTPGARAGARRRRRVGDDVADLEALDAESDATVSTRLAAGSSRAPSRSWWSRRPRWSRRSDSASSGALRERRDEVSARVSRSSSRASLEPVVSTRRARVSRRRRSRRSRRSSRSRDTVSSRASRAAIASRSRASLCSRSWRSSWRVCVRDSMRSRRSVKRSSSRSSRTNASRSAPAAGPARADAEDAVASRLAPRREDDAIAVSGRARAPAPAASARMERKLPISLTTRSLLFRKCPRTDARL